MNFPPLLPISGFNENNNFSFNFVADETFLLKLPMVRPNPKRGELNLWKTTFNYRLSSARKVIQYAFGILISRFRIFHSPIIVYVDNAKFKCMSLYILIVIKVDGDGKVDGEGMLLKKRIDPVSCFLIWCCKACGGTYIGLPYIFWSCG